MTASRCLLVALLATTFFVVAPPGAAQAQDTQAQEDAAGTIVPTRAPKEKRNVLVRNKYFIKKGRLEITPTFGLITDNPMNTEVWAGAGFTYHFSDSVGVEGFVAYAFLTGTDNSKPLARAVLDLLETEELIESTDPGLMATASLVLTPMYGKINPFGSAVINLDFYFVLGLGYANEQIEMLGMPVKATRELVLGGALGPQMNHLFMGHLGFGVNVYLTKFLSFKVDARLHLTGDQVLDFDEVADATQNRNLGPQANRKWCDDASLGGQAACKLDVGTWFVVNFGVSFWVPGDKAARRQARR